MRLYSFLILVLSLITIGQINAQDTTLTYFKSLGKMKQVPESRAGIEILEIFEEGKLVERQVIDTRNGQIRQQKYFNGMQPIGKWQYFDVLGRLTRERDFTKLIYMPLDSLGDLDLLKAESEQFIADGGKFGEFPGGDSELMRFLSKKIVYPVESRDSEVSGIVYIAFVVDTTGKATPSYIRENGLDGYTDLVVWEIVEDMPLWTPGTKNGQAVKLEYNLPVKFSLHR